MCVKNNAYTHKACTDRHLTLVYSKAAQRTAVQMTVHVKHDNRLAVPNI